MEQLRLPESVLALEKASVPDVASSSWVPPPRLSLESEEDTSSSSSTSSPPSPCLVPITATAKPLPSALKNSPTTKPKPGRWKALFSRPRQRQKHVRFASEAPTVIMPLPPDDGLSHAERKRRIWYTAVDVHAFQANMDELQRQLQAQAVNDPTSWPCRYELLYEATVSLNHSDTKHDLVQDMVTKLFRDTNHDITSACLLLDVVGMERLATDKVLQDSLHRRHQHLHAVLDTQAAAPYNNASRVARAIAQASLQHSGPAQAWAQSVAQIIAPSRQDS